MLGISMLLGTIAACGGDDVTEPEPLEIVALDVTVPVTSFNVGALTGWNFQFANGGIVHGDYQSQAIDVTFTAGPQAVLQVPNSQTITGDLSFGSCSVTITEEDTSQFEVGDVITFTTCNARLTSAENIVVDAPQGSPATEGDLNLLLDGESSDGSVIVVPVSATGDAENTTVQVDGEPFASGNVDAQGTFTATTTE